tara:strand:+ start:680 stop:880 length:201 start_codon:yes stop_codon:yes gene_type:complete
MEDCRNRPVKVGDRVRIVENVPSADGVLYSNSIVTIDDENEDKVRVTDRLGKIFWVESSQISLGFL